MCEATPTLTPLLPTPARAVGNYASPDGPASHTGRLHALPWGATPTKFLTARAVRKPAVHKPADDAVLPTTIQGGVHRRAAVAPDTARAPTGSPVAVHATPQSQSWFCLVEQAARFAAEPRGQSTWADVGLCCGAKPWKRRNSGRHKLHKLADGAPGQGEERRTTANTQRLTTNLTVVHRLSTAPIQPSPQVMAVERAPSVPAEPQQ